MKRSNFALRILNALPANLVNKGFALFADALYPSPTNPKKLRVFILVKDEAQRFALTKAGRDVYWTEDRTLRENKKLGITLFWQCAIRLSHLEALSRAARG